MINTEWNKEYKMPSSSVQYIDSHSKEESSSVDNQPN